MFDEGTALDMASPVILQTRAAPLLACGIVLLFMTPNLVESQDFNSRFIVPKDINKPYCSYFANRSPQPAPELRNCTWYKKASCCRQVELDAIFKDIKPILGADEKCTKMLNYMICWVCDPNQHLFYSSQRQELTFCESFCDAILQACQTAITKGELMAHFYQDGRQFCKNHNFHVPESASNETCFPSRTLWQSVGGWRSSAISLQAPVNLYMGLSFLVNSLVLRFL